jgi:8-oxo-dGTP pyrophosphatase MutT (NUDIX family)
VLGSPAGEARLSSCHARLALSAVRHDEQMAVRHATASTFVFARHTRGWRLGLIMHPVFGRLMIPGGHVEGDETPPDAAIREVAEETGLGVQLVAAPAAPVPPSFRDHRRVIALPWWLVEQPIDADNHLAEPHWHLDHLFVGLATVIEPTRRPAHPFGWYSAGELAGLGMFADTRILAMPLFDDIDRIAAVAGSHPGAIC